MLLADGTGHGEDISRSQQRFTQVWSTTRSTQEKILGMLEAQGPDRVKELLRKELARMPEEQEHFHSGRIVGGRIIQ